MDTPLCSWYHRSMKQQFACAYCGKSVARTPAQVVGRVFCSRECCAVAKRGEPSRRRKMVGPDNSKWRGGRILQNGYWCVWIPDHPNSTPRGYVAEHRLIVSASIGRPLLRSEHVHHQDGNRQNNDPANLVLLPGTVHSSLHQQAIRSTYGWSRQHAACIECKTIERRHYGKGLCTRCYHRRHAQKCRAEGYIAPSRRRTQD